MRVDEDLFSEVDSVGGVSGAGIAAFEPAPGVPPPDVFLIAPRGTVDAGDAGVRVAAISSSPHFRSPMRRISASAARRPGIPTAAAVDVAAQTSGSTASAAAAQEAQNFANARNNQNAPSIITVEVLGYDEGSSDDDDKRKKKKKE